MEGISRLDLPARKMLVSDLQIAEQLHSVDSGLTDIKSWKTESTGDTSFSIVWLQGNVSASSGRGRTYFYDNILGSLTTTKFIGCNCRHTTSISLP